MSYKIEGKWIAGDHFLFPIKKIVYITVRDGQTHVDFDNGNWIEFKSAKTDAEQMQVIEDMITGKFNQ